jgi:hypothetical protein
LTCGVVSQSVDSDVLAKGEVGHLEEIVFQIRARHAVRNVFGKWVDHEVDIVPAISSVACDGNQIEAGSVDEEPPTELLEGVGGVLHCDGGEHHGIGNVATSSRAINTESVPRVAQLQSVTRLVRVGTVLQEGVVDTAVNSIHVGDLTFSTTVEFDGSCLVGVATDRAADGGGSEIVDAPRADETVRNRRVGADLDHTAIGAAWGSRSELNIPHRRKIAVNTDIVVVRAEGDVCVRNIAVFEVRTSWRSAIDATDDDGVVVSAFHSVNVGRLSGGNSERSASSLGILIVEGETTNSACHAGEGILGEKKTFASVFADSSRSERELILGRRNVATDVNVFVVVAVVCLVRRRRVGEGAARLECCRGSVGALQAVDVNWAASSRDSRVEGVLLGRISSDAVVETERAAESVNFTLADFVIANCAPLRLVVRADLNKTLTRSSDVGEAELHGRLNSSAGIADQQCDGKFCLQRLGRSLKQIVFKIGLSETAVVNREDETDGVVCRIARNNNNARGIDRKPPSDVTREFGCVGRCCGSEHDWRNRSARRGSTIDAESIICFAVFGDTSVVKSETAILEELISRQASQIIDVGRARTTTVVEDDGGVVGRRISSRVAELFGGGISGREGADVTPRREEGRTNHDGASKRFCGTVRSSDHDAPVGRQSAVEADILAMAAVVNISVGEGAVGESALGRGAINSAEQNGVLSSVGETKIP